MRVWRVTHARHAVDAFSGVGSALVDGRWHSKNVGIPVVYGSSSIPLAMLEILVNSSRAILAKSSFVQIPLDVPKGIKMFEVTAEDVERSSNQWRSFAPYAPITQQIGNAWLKTGDSVILKVPSALVFGGGNDDDFNVLVNPRHKDFARLKIGAPEQCPMDTRLFKRE